MAKNESTAVNDLINLVSTATPRKVGADEDLMFQDPGKRPPVAMPKPPIKIASPRVTGTVPALDSAGVVEPLPRGRGANGTQKNAQLAPPVRISTAPPSRGPTVPSLGLGAGSTATALPPPAPGVRRSAQPPPPLKSSAGFDLSNMSSVGHNLPQSSIGIALPAEPLTAPEERDADRIEARAITKRPPTPAPLPSHVPVASDMTAHAPWFEETGASERSTGPVTHEATFVGTASQLRQPRTTAQWLTKLAPAMGGMIALGIFVGGYVAFDGEGGHKRQPAATTATDTATATAADTATAPAAVAATAPAAVAAPAADTAAAAAADTAPAADTAAAAAAAPAAAAVAAPAAAPAADTAAAPAAVAAPEAVAAVAEPAVAIPVRAKINFADVRIDSKPEGATVMVVDRGKTSFLGTTPLATSLDSSRQYDLVLTYKDRPPQTEHIDPATTPRLTVTMHHDAAYAPAAPAAIAVSAPARAETPAAKPAKKPVTAKVAPATSEPPVAEPVAAAAKAPAASGEGTLMISSKPPCEIYVDGKATGMMTPQRAIRLSAGAHKITLTNAGENITKTITVSITPDQATKVIQDLMAK